MIQIINNPEEFRSNIATKLATLFNGNTNHGINAEKGVYNWAIKEATNRKIVKKWDNTHFVHIYIDHLRSIYTNLKTQNIASQVIDGKVKPQTLAFMTHQEMCPDRWSELIAAKSIKDKNKFEQNIEAMTDIFTCRKCKSKKCSFYQLQTRSADEPMTIFVSCLDCGQRWKTS